MRSVCCIFITALLVLNCAEQGGVEGIVVDRESGHPVPNVRVQVPESNFTGLSDRAGHYRVPAMGRDFILLFEREGFEPVRVQAVEMKPDRWYRMDVALIPDTR